MSRAGFEVSREQITTKTELTNESSRLQLERAPTTTKHRDNDAHRTPAHPQSVVRRQLQTFFTRIPSVIHTPCFTKRSTNRTLAPSNSDNNSNGARIANAIGDYQHDRPRRRIVNAHVVTSCILLTLFKAWEYQLEEAQASR